MAAGDVRRVAAAPSRDHLRDQPALSRRDARGVPRRRRPAAPHVVDRRGRREECAHGAPGDRRQPLGQRCRRAALRAAQGERPQGLLRDVARAVLQQDQRCDASPLPGAGQPRAARSCSTAPSATAGSPTSVGSVAWKPFADDPAFREEWREVKRANKSGLARVRPRDHRHRSEPRRSSMFRSSGSTNTSASTSTSCTSSRCTTGSSRTRAWRSRRARSCSAARRRRATSWPSASSG